MYATLYQTRYSAHQAHVDVINQLAKTAGGFDGTLECGFAQGAEDLITGAQHAQDFSKDGICYALVIMWLRMKFEKKANTEFYDWLLAKDVQARNLKMSKWMQKQLFAKDLGNPGQAKLHSEFMALVNKGPAHTKFTTRYPAADLPAWVNFLSEEGARGTPLDPSYSPAKFSGKSQRARYDLARETSSYRLTQLDSRMQSLQIWEEDTPSRGEVYAAQLAASKITKAASDSQRLSSTAKDRIISATLQSSYDPDKDADGGEKRMEAARLLVDALLKYQKEIKNQDQFVLVSFCRHVVGVFFSRSPLTGSGTIEFFDPNYGVWRFVSSSRDERCTHFRKFFYVLSYLYRDMDSLTINIFSRH